MLLEAKRGEVDALTEDFCFGEDTDATNTINFHFHVWIAVRIAEVSQVRSPSRVFCVAFDDNGILIERIRESEGRLRLLPGVQIIGLFSTKPVGKWSPNI